jgi:hypothetical protein
MILNRGLFAAALICAMITSPHADAASCDAQKSKFMWRRCMSKEIDRLTDAISQKALDLCGSRTNSASGPAAVDERLTCRIEKLSKTLQAMN